MDRLTVSELHSAIDSILRVKTILVNIDFEVIDLRDCIEMIESIQDRLYSTINQ